MRQRLTGIQFLAGHFIVNRRPVAIIQKPLDQIGRRSQIFQSLLVLDTDRGAAELGIPVLTLFAFSTENWTRPADEVNDLMGLLRHYLRTELDELRKNGARLRVIGNRDGLSSDIVRDISDAENMTRGNSRIDVNICVNYGARDEILQATRSLARQVAAGELSADRIDEDRFANELLTAGVPDPDLLIRTSGEQRISNFLLWQCAYAELVFVDTLWPDFGKEHLEQAIAEFRRRERRYGGVGS